MAEKLSVLEKGSFKIHECKIGAPPEEGGSRGIVFTVGGQAALPFLFKEGEMPHRPIVAAEIIDYVDEDFPSALREDLKDVLKTPVDWASKMMQESGADLVCLKLLSIHPDFGNTSAREALSFVQKVLKKVKVPLVILGCGNHQKDNEVLPVISEATKAERLLFGSAVQENYKTLTVACIADGHNIIAESPIDVNIAKQVNILITDQGMPPDRIAINPTIGGLGYGLEYAYSIMERARNAALAGDKMLAMPFVCFVGQEAWRAKEAKVSEEEFPLGGNTRERGVMWEVVTATACLEAGADILTMRHPKAIKIVKGAIEDLMKK